MLQQTQVATVLPYYERWLARFPSFAALAAASEHDVLSLWQGLGYYSRARNLHRAAQDVASRFGGTLPSDPALLETLPGVGRYTAGALAAFAFDLPVATIDANIARVLTRLIDLRLPIDAEPGASTLWKAAAALQPKKGGRVFNSALMELGALICTARVPRCGECPIRGHCATTDPEALPVKKARPRMVPLDEPCAWIRQGERMLLEQQMGARWRGLWKLPRLSTTPPEAPPALTFTYPFTHHRVTLRVFAEAPPRHPGANQSWISTAEFATLPITAPHRRAVERLLGGDSP